MVSNDVVTTAFGGLVIETTDANLSPRPWTVRQSCWATELAGDGVGDPVLELCCGAGHIGLEFVRHTGRSLVQVDASASACEWARHNAARNGLGSLVEIRHAPLSAALAAGERFALVLADPPYVPSGDIGLYPDDPPHAIDGGEDGLTVVREMIGLLADHVTVGAFVLLQVRGLRQAAAIEDLLIECRSPFGIVEIRLFGRTRAVMGLRSIG
jgi:release factor glutamine methyltransferase